MSDQFTKTRARAEKLAQITDGLIDQLAHSMMGDCDHCKSSPLDPMTQIEKAATSLGHAHAALCEERAYLNDMVDEGVLDEEALDFDDDPAE